MKIVKVFVLIFCSVLSSFSVAQTKIRFAHFWPATSDIHKNLFEEWANAIYEDSNGQLKVELYPSQTLVKANASYNGVISGITDVVAFVQGYNAGRFPLSEIIQLPGISSSAMQGACVFQTLYEEGDLKDEYNDTHLLFVFTTGPAYLHTTNKKVKTPDDFKGLKIRRPNSVGGEMLEQMGASAVGLPAPEVYQALEKGMLDGLSFPFEAMKVFRINELVNHHLQMPYANGLFAVTMNKRTYDNLPDELKKVIDKNSGMEWAMKAANVFHQLDKEGIEEAKEQGDSIYVIDDPLSDELWGPVLVRGTNVFLDRITEQGNTTAKDVYQKALSLREACSQPI